MTTYNVLTPYESNGVKPTLATGASDAWGDPTTWNTLYENQRQGNSANSLYRYTQTAVAGLPKNIDLKITVTQGVRNQLAKGGKTTRPAAPETTVTVMLTSALVGENTDGDVVSDEQVLLKFEMKFPAHSAVSPNSVLFLTQILMTPLWKKTGAALTSDHLSKLMSGSADVL